MARAFTLTAKIAKATAQLEDPSPRKRSAAKRTLDRLKASIEEQGPQTYWDIADELNDENDEWHTNLTFPDDFDEDSLLIGEAHARRESLPWPPPTGFLDTAYELKIGRFAPLPKAERTVAWDRDESDPCERSTPGCSVHHPAGDEEPCETW